MYTKKELAQIKKALPKNGFKLISDKLVSTTPDAVRKVLTEPLRYRPEVFDAVVQVMREYKAAVDNQKKEVMEAVK